MGDSMRNFSILASVTLSLLLATTSATAQNKLGFKCTFGPGTVANWDSGKVKIERANFGDPNVTIHFDSIDAKAGTARMIANVGSTTVIALFTETGLTLIEQTRAGNLSFTTIFMQKPKRPSELAAVMSRHIDIPTGPFPSQYYGTCVPW